MQFKVRLPSGRVVIGSLVQIDFKYDLAVVKIRACTWFSGSSSQF
jgi:S1-C subfamily serine protease